MPDACPQRSDPAAPRRARIFIIEDNLLVRRAVMALIGQQPDLECCGETEALAGAELLVAQAAPDLVLLGLYFRDGDAFPLIELLKRQAPELPVLVFSQSAEPADVIRAWRAGARGYLLKEDAADALITAVRTLLQGGLFSSPALADSLLDESILPDHGLDPSASLRPPQP